jgi:hypothetical protein
MWYKKNINTHHHMMGLYVVHLQNPSDTNAHCSQQATKIQILLGLKVCAAVPTTLDYLRFSNEAHFHLDGFMNKYNIRFWASENSQGHGDIAQFSKMHHVVCNQQATAYWTNFWGEHHKKPVVPAATAKRGHSGSRACGQNILSARWFMLT